MAFVRCRYHASSRLFHIRTLRWRAKRNNPHAGSKSLVNSLDYAEHPSHASTSGLEHSSSAKDKTEVQNVAMSLQADDLLLQLALRRAQHCSLASRAGHRFLHPQLLSLIARRRVSSETRFLVCCLLTVFLASVAPEQANQARQPYQMPGSS